MNEDDRQPYNIMSNWTKETALIELSDLINEISNLSSQQRYSSEHTRWIAKTMTLLEEVFGENSKYYLTFADYQWRETGSFVIGGVAHKDEVWDPQMAIERRHHKAYLSQLESARGLLQAAQDHLKKSDLSQVFEGRGIQQETSAIFRIIDIGERKLRKVIRNKPQNEKEVQNSFESLLIGADIGYSRESETIVYSSKKYIPDFIIKDINLAVELKLCGKDTREKEIIAEINDDILAYLTKCEGVLFLVYDMGFIRDINQFIDTFELNQNVFVRVIKH